ncbi:hypothetical protein O181_015665 [Austropuccinia psidii MF-1]|uniref:Uncharacterized protein n=1 Tax=Austropuccinia psidii MF-1 TaxID=1389203 RepID=A0A9Q3C4C3_9BASI|nr:hypothetical protein [Austropuccinia psidii MF-1]
MKEVKNSHFFEIPKEDSMNKEISEDHVNQEEEISPIEKELMRSIIEYGLDPEEPWIINKEKKMDFHKENSSKCHDNLSYWKIPIPEEEPDYLILCYMELKEIYY